MGNKGSAWERDVAKFLSVWLTGEEKPYQYWRSPQSGGLATISELNKDLTGDIQALTTEAKFLTNIYSLELKTGYPKTSFWQHFKDIKNFHLEAFWKQCVEDARKGNKLPMLIYRKKGNKPIVGISDSSRLRKLNKLQNISMDFHKDKDLPSVTFYNMEEFFEIVTPEYLKKRYKEKING